MSTATIAGQTPINNTIQVNVRPGDETGLYYILLSNLPWQTSWQQLKDHVRTVCSGVDRVEIFNESTSGWVCVRGRESYSAAMRLLETAPFNGRPIWADGRNATVEIPIRRLVGTPDLLGAVSRSPRTPRTAQQTMQYSTNAPQTMSPDASQYSQWSTCAAPITSSSSTAYELSSVPTAVDHGYQNCEGWYPSYDNNCMDDSAVMPTGTTSYLDSSYQYSQYDPFYENNYSATSTYPSGQELLSTNPTYNPTSGHGVVETERRKIIIKGLVKRAASDQLKELLRLRCGFSGGEFTAIDIPQSREGGNRGHATITFVGEDYATRAIAKLHKHKYDGKTLSVDYTSEYVSKNEDRRKSHHHSSRHHREDKERKESFKSSSSSQEKKEKSVKKGVIIIANGSTQTPSGSIKRSR